MTITRERKETVNTSNLNNFLQPKIVKDYQDNTPVTNVSETLNETSQKAADTFNGVSFERTPQVINFSEPEEGDEPQSGDKESVQLTDEQRRKARREDFHRAANAERRALEMQKQANAQIKQANQFQALMEQAKKDPTAVAKALGMEPTEFLRQYQNAMFSIPNTVEEKKLSPEQEMQEKINQLIKERDEEKRYRYEQETLQQRSLYVQNKIMPLIQADPDKYELVARQGETLGGYIYDMLNKHWLETNQEITEQDIANVLDTTEKFLSDEIENRLGEVKKTKRFGKHFRVDTDAPGQDVTIPETLGGVEQRHSAANNILKDTVGEYDISSKVSQSAPTRNKVGEALSPSAQLGGQSAINAGQRQVSWDRKKESRLNRVNQAVKAAK